MNIPAATKIDNQTLKRFNRASSRTHLKMADMLRVGLERVLTEIEETGGISLGSATRKTKGGRAK